MGRPKGSKNKVKPEDVSSDETRTDLPAVDGPPDRLAAHLAAEAAPKPPGQAFFDGMAPVRHQAIDDANDVWRGWDAKSREATEKKKAARQNVLQKMKDHGLTFYKTHDGWILERKEDEKVKARRADGDSVERVTYSRDSGQINPESDDEEDVDMDLDIPIGENEQRAPGEVAA